LADGLVVWPGPGLCQGTRPRLAARPGSRAHHRADPQIQGGIGLRPFRATTKAAFSMARADESGCHDSIRQTMALLLWRASWSPNQWSWLSSRTVALMKRWASRYVALPVARECKQYVDKVLSELIEFTTNKSEQCLSSEGACSRALGVGSARPL